MPDPDQSRPALPRYLILEVIGLLLLVVFLLMAQNHSVGDSLLVTAAGAGLMAAVTCWSLATCRQALEWLAVHTR